jgi:D-alanine-D-alanine ligase
VTERISVAVIFGGRSGEHEVSLRSAESIINSLDKSKYEVVPIGITKDGGWLISDDATALLPQAVMDSNSRHQVAIIGDPTRPGLERLDADPGENRSEPFDVVFPVLHGPYGEDGTIQGLLDMAGVPYVGCGVLASSTGLDKIVMKHLFEQAGLTVAKYEWFLRSAWEKDPREIVERIVKSLGFPAFVKPANLGSSVGVSKVRDETELTEAIDEAAGYDRRLIVERAVVGREIEVSVLGNDEPKASRPGEIVVGHEFYDYEDKYVDHASRTVVPAKLTSKIEERIQHDAITAFKAIDGSGLARVDFFIERGRVIINEINTMPGFTSISMFPKLWAASGITYAKLIDRLIELAFERHEDRARNRTSYTPKERWHIARGQLASGD